MSARPNGPVPSHWTQVNENRWQRRDGAVVLWDLSSPYPNPALNSSRLWSAWEPDPGTAYMSYTRRDSPFNIKRRWKSAERAMAAVDKEFPLTGNPGKAGAAR